MKKVAFIGAGNMNSSILIGMVNQGFSANDIMVSNPSAPKREALAQQYGIQQSEDNIKAANFADVIVLGVKPHFIKQVCREIAAHVDLSNKCFISVAAGISLQQMQSELGDSTAIIRCMPNTPSQLGIGMTGVFANSAINSDDEEFTNSLLNGIGKVLWLQSEAEIDDLLAVSASGPAYFFAFMEAMQNKAMEFGFSEKIARELVQQTAVGAAQMVIQNTDSIATLRENVTSKGGTTQAALNVFKVGNLDDLVDNAMDAAKQRSIEITTSNN
ncbi:pyrroline-5-carboxylate reductase [Thalassotalea psychrophila]|uniref:Pyrroline-5-carboxylate reductase n=1 Tax=Thalassotalea psychrophila TaxID=3065647 RepID=A0ABY9TWS1_9GAMM|nr:pyrroline-5-carboxylate reductase [Colwelliaceae bacterium SQ149]